MKIIEKIQRFLNLYFFTLFKANTEASKLELPDNLAKVDSSNTEEIDEAFAVISTTPTIEELEVAIKNIEDAKMESKIKVVKMTLTRLYMLRQKIIILRESFPEKYQSFEEQINELEKDYNDSLLAIQSDLTYEIDPETDGEKLGKLKKLEVLVESFIEKEVKFDILIKKFQKLILKLNILYNVSVVHKRPEERSKAMSQLGKAVELEIELVHKFKASEYLVADLRLKDEVIKFVSYLDYQIFKLAVRNSDRLFPNVIVEKLITSVEFTDFDYAMTFKAYLEDELAGINDLIARIKNDGSKNVLKREHANILEELAYSEDLEKLLLDNGFWLKIFELENKVFDILADEGEDKDKIKIRLVMQITVTEKDVLVSPKTSTYLALISIYSKKQDDRLSLVMKLLENISDDVTYREIYFLIVLFDVLDLFKTTSNELITHLEKYLEKYPYDSRELNKRKQQVFSSDNSEYFYVFALKDYEKNLIDTLKKLNIDFIDDGNKIFINSFYFNGLTTVIDSLKKITN